MMLSIQGFIRHRAYGVLSAFQPSFAETRFNPQKSFPHHAQRSFAHIGSQKPFLTSKHGLFSRDKKQYRTSPAATRVEDVVTAGSLDLKKNFDTIHPAFEVLEKDIVSEYGAYCTLYRHKKSGAELLSVSVDDDSKVFGITLRTPPDDSTGVPHILEHSVLCGSRKYKTKDPFVHLLKGSLQTFLNAFTYPDRTCYVVASQNEKDFYNLVNVYADAVYHPRAVNDPMVLAQEGWHLELDEDNKLVYNGVVYNEMKGVYSSADSILSRASQKSLFLSNTYAVDSGGDPSRIPDLTFEQFKEFHEKHYHPSNSRIYFAGDDDVSKRLELMDEYLKEFDACGDFKQKSKIDWQPKIFSEPRRQIGEYPVGADQKATHMFTLNWLLNDAPLSADEELTLGVLDHLMMATPSSILRKTLLESGLGEAITGGGLSDDLLQATFSVGLKGVEGENVVKAEQLILDTLEKLEKEGFTMDDIASSMNTVEFQLREFNTGSFPKYLSFMLGANSKWLYEESPTLALKFEEPLAELKSKIARSGSKIFQDMISTLFIQNTHRTCVELRPSKTMEEDILIEERKRLERIKANLSDDELDQIVQKSAELKALQAAEDSAEARATIPSLQLSDLKRESTEYPIEVNENEHGSGVTVVRHQLSSTSGIAYVNFAVDLSRLSLDDASLLPLFTRMITETGAGDYDAVALSRRIGTFTGGVRANILTTPVYAKDTEEGIANSGENIVTKLMIQGKATSDNIDELLSIYKLVLTDAKLDSQSKAIEMLKETKSRLESRVQSAGHSMANTRMKARYRVAGYIDEITSGISYLETVKKLLVQAQDEWPSILARLERIRNTILDEQYCRSGMILDVTAEKIVMDKIQPSLQGFLSSLPGEAGGKILSDFYREQHPWVSDAKVKMEEFHPISDEGFVVPTQVSYVGKAGILFSEGERIPGSAAVVARFLRTGYLWDYVRVMGGAYGGFCVFSPFSGLLSFLSYRDPNLEKTIDVYDGAADALMAAADALENDPDALAAAIIGAIGDIDSALSPDQKGYTSFQRWLINESSEYRQTYRDEILRTKPSDFRDFAERLRNIQQPSIAVVSSRNAFETAATAGKRMSLKDVFLE